MHELVQPCAPPALEWPAAADLIRPVLLPRGATLIADPAESRLVAEGPAGLAVAYVIAGLDRDVRVEPADMAAWGVGPADVRAAAEENLARWDRSAGWMDDTEGSRRMVWSDSGEGLDAARILLAGVRGRLETQLAERGRVLVGLPERDLLIATGVAEGDNEFEAMFADYVAGRSAASDRPIDARLFELVDGELILLRVATAA